jgi:hypothetical protein
MLEEFAHDTGAHCGSTSLHDVATFASWNLPEPLCFGIGGGLGFGYFERESSPSRQFVGRTPWLETAFFDHLGVAVDDERGGDADAALAHLQSYLDAGRPVVVFVDIYHLPYFDSDVHFSPHVVVAIDYDEDTISLADSEFETVQTVTQEAFDAAWSSGHGFFGALDRRILVARDDPSRDRTAAMRDGIQAAADGLLHPETAYAGFVDVDDGTFGLEGMREMGRALPEWRELADAEWCTRFAYQNVEKRGTGGAAFRGLFRPFLETASEHLEGVTDGDVAEMRGIESDWHDVGQTLKRAGLADDPGDAQAAYEDASAALLGVADREEALFSTLTERL